MSNSKLEQAQRLEEAKRIEKNQKTLMIFKKIGIWGGVFAALILMVWGLAKLGTPSANGPVTLTESVTAEDHTKGNPLAKVVLVEYSDFQCPACAQFYPVVKAVEQKFGKDILLVYRHFPLPSHDKSNLAARAAEAAGKQGKFWEMHDKLFETQNSWATLSNAEQTFTDFAVQLGLNKEKFTTDLKDKTIEDRIQKDIASGSASGLQGTPTFYLNGKMLNLQTYGDLESLISSAIAENK